MKPMQQLLVAVLIAACSGSVGFGYSQTIVGRQVITHEAQLIAGKEKDAVLQKELSELRESQRQSMRAVADMFAENSKATRELITLVRENLAVISALQKSKP
jgi:type IV pilus biogenesis protein CpaD/CtpE